MRFAGLLAVVVAVALLAGCGTESPRQADARAAVNAGLGPSTYEVGETRCTGNPSSWLTEREASVFICIARKRDGSCDWYRASLRNAGWAVQLDRRDGDCVPPF